MPEYQDKHRTLMPEPEKRRSSLTPNIPINAPSEATPNAQFGHSFTEFAIDTPATAERDRDASLPGAVFGETGAMGRNTMVKAQEGRAYDAGLNAPRGDFDGTLHRTVATERGGRPVWDGYVDHLGTDVKGGRYNDVGERLIYASPSAAESLGEMGAYGSMANRTAVDFHYDAKADPATGKGGVADISSNLADLGLTRGALTERKGGEGPDLFHKIMGEDPYLHTRALGRGAQEGGASGMLVPSATGGNQLDIIPRNTDPAQIQYESHTSFDTNGTPGPLTVDPMHLSQHATPNGPGVMPAGDSPVPTDSYHQNNPFETSTGRTSRAGSARYGLVGGIAGALVNDVVQGRGPSLDTAGDLAVQGGVGVGGGLAQDLLHARLGGGITGGAGAGGLISAVTSGAFSTYDNGEQYRQGKETAGQATANTIVDTGVGLSAGLAGAGLGAAIGSVIPVAGTAVGAGVGFLAGMAGGYAANWAAEHSGFTDWAKQGLGHAFSADTGKGFWDAASGVTHGIHDGWEGAKRGIHGAEHAVADGASHAWHGAEHLASNALHGAEHLGSNMIHAGEHLASEGLHGFEHLAERGFHGAEHLGMSALHGGEHLAEHALHAGEHLGMGAIHGAEHLASNALHGAEHLGLGAVHGAEHLASGALHGAENVAHGVGDAASSAWNKVTSWF